MILSFMVVTSVLVVSLGRLGDMYGRVRMYNLGFAVYTFFSLVLAVTWMSGTAAALWLVVMRVFQGVGAALLIANSAAILTDAFPEDERGMALGINQVAGLSGSFIGLILGGLLAPIEWRLIFLVSVPTGLFGTVWAYTKLARGAPPGDCEPRLAGEHRLRPGPGRDSGRHHLRHPALRPRHHGVDEPVRARLPQRRSGRCWWSSL